MNEPVLGKRKPHGNSYKQFTWSAFLELKEAAQKTADASGFPVYLVGSVLFKEAPRDIDVSVILPSDEYEKRFKPLPTKQEYYSAYLNRVFHLSWEFTCHMHFCIEYDLDIKVCPDTWWPDKPKMLLAYPNSDCTHELAGQTIDLPCPE